MYYPDIHLEGLSRGTTSAKDLSDCFSRFIAQPTCPQKMNHTEKEFKKALLKVSYGVVCDATELSHITDRSRSRASFVAILEN
jgi:hypothetical protein